MSTRNTPPRCPEAIVLGVTSLLFVIACSVCFYEYLFQATLTSVILCLVVLEVALLLGIVANELARRRLIEWFRAKNAANLAEQAATMVPIDFNYNTSHASQISYGTYVPRNQAYSMATEVGSEMDDNVIHPGTTAIRSKPFDSPNYVYGGTLTRASSREKLVINRAQVWIGRGNEGVDLRIEGNNNVSRRHARLVVRNGVTYISDNNTHNGTFVNNARLVPGKEHRLVPGDILYLGTERFQYDW